MKQQHLQIAASALAALALNPALRAETVVGEPDAYLDYIEATGSQYIDTGVKAETGLKARIDMEWGAVVIPASSTGGDDWSMLDARKTGDTRFYMCHIARKSSNDGFVFGYGYNAWHRTSTDPGRETRHEILTDFSDQATLHAYRNGAEMLSSGQQTGHANETIDLGINLYLFACNYNSTASYFAHGKLYECKIFRKNGETGDFDLLRHYLPCIKDGRAGLYDKANGKIYYSDGNDDFVAGTEQPRPAALVEWIEADGTTSSSVAQQYVDTGVWGKLGLRSAVDVMLLESSGDHAVLAARGSGSSTNYRLYMAYHYNEYFCYGDGKLREPKLADAKPVSGTRYLIESDLSASSQSVKVNGTELYQDTFTGTAQFATDSTLTLFANNHKNAFVKNPSHSRLYSAKIWDGDELLRDFVPCMASDGEAGLYDTVSERVFKSATKAFAKATQLGTVTNVLIEAVAPKNRIEYVDSDGVSDYVDLGITGKDGIEMDAVMEWLTVPNDGAFVGARTDLQNNHDNGKAGVRFFLYHHWSSGGSGHRIGYDGQIRGNETVATANTKYRIRSHLDAGDQKYAIEAYENGAWSAPIETTTAYGGPVNTGLSLWLFAMNFDNEPKYYGKARVYSLKLRAKQQDGSYAPVRDFVPVRDPLTGGAALWDRVSETYFRNGGQFLLAGGDVERPMESPFVLVVR